MKAPSRSKLPDYLVTEILLRTTSVHTDIQSSINKPGCHEILESTNVKVKHLSSDYVTMDNTKGLFRMFFNNR